jgi:hypothetical protein
VIGISVAFHLSLVGRPKMAHGLVECLVGDSLKLEALRSDHETQRCKTEQDQRLG